MMRSRTLIGAATLVSALLTVGAAGAADMPPPAPVLKSAPLETASDWRFQATFYGWLTAIDGDVGVRDLPTSPVNASIGDVLGDLDGALMGSFMATNGKWLFLGDLVLAKLSSDKDVGLYGNTRFDAELKQTIMTGAVGYWLPLGLKNLDIAVTGGLRYVDLSADLSLKPAALPVTLSGSQSESWVDPTVGMVASWKIDDKWFANAIVDIGGFGIGSKLSSTGYLGVGYMWTPSISTAIGYRYLYENYESSNGDGGSFRYNTTMHGPTVSVAWHF
ncbi:MAG: hypothetical protein DI549_21215 [Ancylobacter novellus]|uniref:Outer membrane protein beta-barrel domain-containing protein n=1 Tax=Ancylobacter novellus TaxID=921 RepID=A0A2W5QP82_ANCNO|nr:MAG: hypothetical protein DI549_21215 [Ancylobacter novellus]